MPLYIPCANTSGLSESKAASSLLLMNPISTSTAGMVVFFLALTVAAMLLTSVNDILFGDVVVSLLDVLRKGGLDGL